MRDTQGYEYGPTVVRDTYGTTYVMDSAYLEYCDMAGVQPSSEAWMSYQQWRQAGNEMA